MSSQYYTQQDRAKLLHLQELGAPEVEHELGEERQVRGQRKGVLLVLRVLSIPAPHQARLSAFLECLAWQCRKGYYSWLGKWNKDGMTAGQRRGHAAVIHEQTKHRMPRDQQGWHACKSRSSSSRSSRAEHIPVAEAHKGAIQAAQDV